MPPRIPLLKAARLPEAFSISSQQTRLFCQTTAVLALKKHSTAASQILGAAEAKDATAVVSDMWETFRPRTGETRRRGSQNGLSVDSALTNKRASEDYMRQMPRRWREGEVYAPHDLSPVEMKKWRKRTTEKADVVDLLGLKPLDMYRNFSFISEYMTPYGRIKGSVMTGLRPVNQRKVTKAIRRAIGLGIHPSVHRHPEILMREAMLSRGQTTPGRDRY